VAKEEEEEEEEDAEEAAMEKGVTDTDRRRALLAEAMEFELHSP